MMPANQNPEKHSLYAEGRVSDATINNWVERVLGYNYKIMIRPYSQLIL